MEAMPKAAIALEVESGMLPMDFIMPQPAVDRPAGRGGEVVRGQWKVGEEGRGVGYAPRKTRMLASGPMSTTAISCEAG